LFPDPDATVFYALGRTSHYYYEGDSVMMEIDSSRYGRQIFYVLTQKQTWHWEKTAPPDPRPLLWPDSICTSKTIFRKMVDYQYKDLVDSVPYFVKSDSSLREAHWKIENGKVISFETVIYYGGYMSKVYEISNQYTLNGEYDTAITKVTEKRCLDDHSMPCDQVVERTPHVTTYHTLRSGEYYIIDMKKDRIGLDRNITTEPFASRVRTKNPWTNDELMPGYDEVPIFNNNDPLFTERWAMKHAKVKTVYWQ
jgi:hypothetical protein